MTSSGALVDSHEFDSVERVAMPADNLSLVFRRRADFAFGKGGE